MITNLFIVISAYMALLLLMPSLPAYGRQGSEDQNGSAYGNFANNGYQLDGDESPGKFAIYRMGITADTRSQKGLIDKVCEKGISEFMVLSGNSHIESMQLMRTDANGQPPCRMNIVYNYDQMYNEKMSREFLQFYLDWVDQAKRYGKKIGFRCNCGCHRTGRLAAFHRLYFEGVLQGKPITVKELMDEMRTKAQNREPKIFPYLERELSYLHECLITKKRGISQCAPVASDSEKSVLSAARDGLEYRESQMRSTGTVPGEVKVR